MWRDPIVAEVRKARGEIAKECNYDMDVFFDRMRRRELARKKNELASAGGKGRKTATK